MNVYIDNKAEVMTIDGTPVASYSDIKNLFSSKFNVPAYWETPVTSANIDLTGNNIRANTVIVGRNNAAEIRCRVNTNHFYRVDTSTDPVVMFEFPETLITLIQILVVNTPGNIALNYLYVGNNLELPRFVVEPVYTKMIRSPVNRTFGGFTYGLQQEPLRKFSTRYIRISDEVQKKVEKYVYEVGTTIPHIIDPYPKARENVPPFWATLNIESYERTKRNENKFWWNFNLEWLEAR